MSDAQMDDLKQFIDGRLSQTEARLDARIDGLEQRFDGLEQRFDQLEQKLDDGFAGIGNAFETFQAETDNRLSRLEENAA